VPSIDRKRNFYASGDHTEGVVQLVPQGQGHCSSF